MNVGFTVLCQGPEVRLAINAPEGQGGPARCAAGDAGLALAMYREFGLEALERLEGDFALALWDARAARLIGLRDPLGGYPLYWTEAGATFALGTCLTPLLQVLGRRSLSPD